MLQRCRVSLNIVCALAITSACSELSSPERIPSVAGTWDDLVFEADNAVLAVSCDGSGSVIISQQGSTFSGDGDGSVACSTPVGLLEGEGDVRVTNGLIDGTRVAFRFTLAGGTCDASGTASGDPVSDMAGTISCSITESGQTVVVTGTWQASR